MAHRVNFNVYRYGKTVHWNFSAPFLHTQKTMRMNYIMLHWVRRVLQSGQIKSFKIFFGLGGEFPFIKVVGYRRLYLLFNRKFERREYASVLRTSKIASADNVLPIYSSSVPVKMVSQVSIKRRAGKHRVLRSRIQSRKLQRSMYYRPGPAIISNINAGEQLRRLLFFELNSNARFFANNEESLDEKYFSEGAELRFLLEDSIVGNVSWGINLDSILNAFSFHTFFFLQQRKYKIFTKTPLKSRLPDIFDSCSTISTLKEFSYRISSKGLSKFILSLIWLARFVKLYKNDISTPDEVDLIVYNAAWRRAVKTYGVVAQLMWIVRLYLKLYNKEVVYNSSKGAGDPFGGSMSILRFISFWFQLLRPRNFSTKFFKKSILFIYHLQLMLYFVKKWKRFERKRSYFLSSNLSTSHNSWWVMLRLKLILFQVVKNITGGFRERDFSSELIKEEKPYHIAKAVFAANLAGAVASLNRFDHDLQSNLKNSNTEFELFKNFSLLKQGSSETARPPKFLLANIRVRSLRALFDMLYAMSPAGSRIFYNHSRMNSILINENVLTNAFQEFKLMWRSEYSDFYSISKKDLTPYKPYNKPELLVNDITDTLHLPSPRDVARASKDAARFSIIKRDKKLLRSSRKTWAQLARELASFTKSTVLPTKISTRRGQLTPARLLINKNVYTKAKIERVFSALNDFMFSSPRRNKKNKKLSPFFDAVKDERPARIQKLIDFLRPVYKLLIEIDQNRGAASFRPHDFFADKNYSFPHLEHPSFVTRMFPFSSKPFTGLFKALNFSQHRGFSFFLSNYYYLKLLLTFCRSGQFLIEHLNPAKLSTGENILALSSGISQRHILQNNLILTIRSMPANYGPAKTFIGPKELIFTSYYFNRHTEHFMKIGTHYRYTAVVPGAFKKTSRYFKASNNLKILGVNSSAGVRAPSSTWAIKLLAVFAPVVDHVAAFKNILEYSLFSKSIRPSAVDFLTNAPILFTRHENTNKFVFKSSYFYNSLAPQTFVAQASLIDDKRWARLQNALVAQQNARENFASLPGAEQTFLPSTHPFADYGKIDNFIDKKFLGALTLDGKIRPEGLETRTMLLNLSTAFYVAFGAYYNIFYYPFPRVFQSDPKMQELASNTITFLKTYITRQAKSLIWLNDFTLLFYASIYLKTTEILIAFMAKRFEQTKYWSQPWYFMLSVMKSIDLKPFGIAGIRLGFHGKFNGHDRAYRFYKVLGANPCLRNSYLTGSYSTIQCKSKYGITHIHIWLTYF